MFGDMSPTNEEKRLSTGGIDCIVRTILDVYRVCQPIGFMS